MFIKILKRDFLHNKSVTVILLLFVLLAALLVSSGINVVMNLTGSIDYLFKKANVPHYVQMNSGEADQSKIDHFTIQSGMVKKQQTMRMLNIDGSNIYMGSSMESEANSVMDNSFVTQNKEFDYLLNLKDEIVQVKKGEIAVPIYYKQKYQLKTGDPIRIQDGKFTMEFTIVDFVRDAMMNPSIVSSKRFVVNGEDLKTMKENTGETECLIEFQLNDLSRLNEFGNLYQSSDLPKKGPNIGYNLFLLLNAMTDGIMAAIMILVSLLLIVIAVLCLRFTMIAAIEEDYREIGVLKAIGISRKDMKRIYLFKYAVLAAAASLAGYLLSIPVSRFLTSNIALYIGLAPQRLAQLAVPALGAVFIALLIILSCMLILRRFHKISAVEALRSGNAGNTVIPRDHLKLYRRSTIGVNLFQGVKDVFCRFRMYGLLLVIFIISSFIIIVPVNIRNTMKSPGFMSYLGIGESEVRIDLQHTDKIDQRFKDMVNYLEQDLDVAKLSALITCRFQMLNNEGSFEGINVETGDQSIFPINYMEGSAPAAKDEIALSYLCAKNAGKKVGDPLVLQAGGKEKKMTVCGIYQDVTNGGITAKAQLTYDPKTALWYIVNLDFKPGVVIEDKKTEYSSKFNPAKVTDVVEYASQTFGDTRKQLNRTTVAAVLIAIVLSVLITSFFIKMLTAKDARQIAIMRSLGLSQDDIRRQYLVKMLTVLLPGIILGMIAANTLGEMLAGVIMSNMGASKIEFIVNPLQSYLLCPFCLIVTVTVTTILGIMAMKEANIREIISE